ncbi:dynamin family protein [Rhodococcus koreensis]
MSTPPTTGAQQLTDVVGLRSALEAILRDIGADSVQHRLGPRPAGGGDSAKVVVVGEVQTGKSSLINALLGRPDLLPVDVGASALVAVGSGAPERIRAHLGDGHVVTDGLDHLDRYLRENPAEVSRVDVRIDDPRLTELTLLDTPGTGGMNAAAARATRTALDDATALMFVCSAAAKISLTERAFLVEAVRRIDRVVFVLTKIDAYASWEENLRENEDTVRGHARLPDTRFADLAFLPVSAHLARLGVARNEPALIADSGIAAVWAQLAAIAATHTHHAQLNELRAIRSALSDAYRILGERAHAIDDSTTADTIASITEQCDNLRKMNATWRTSFAREVETARDDVHKQFNSRSRQLRVDCEHKFAEATRGHIAQLETGVVEDLCELQRQTDTDVREHVVEIARRMLTGVPAAESAVAELTEQLPRPTDTPSDYLATRPPPPKDPCEAMIGIQTTLLGANMARTVLSAGLSSVGLAGLVANPLTAPIAAVLTVPFGLVWYRLQKRTKQHAADVAGLRTWASSSIADATAEIRADIDRGFRHASYALQEAVEQALVDAQAQAAEQQDALHRARKDAAIEKARIDQLKKRVRPLQQSCDRQMTALRAQTQTDAPTAGSPGSRGGPPPSGG